MPYAISNDCLNCGSCELECSFGAVLAGGAQRLIDATLCRDCGACAAVCPLGAIQGPLARAQGQDLPALSLLKTIH